MRRASPETAETTGAGTGPDAPDGALPRASAAERLRLAQQVLLPKLAEGVVLRRRGRMAEAERQQSDARAVALLAALRARHGPGPLRAGFPGLGLALVLEPEDVARVLSSRDEPFTPATRGKRAALSAFQPHGSLVSRGERRAAGLRVNEAALEAGRPLHALAPRLREVVGEEAEPVAERAVDSELTWDDFAAGWWRSVRRAVLGDDARDDVDLTAQLDLLRRAGNWPVPHPGQRRRRAAFLRRLRQRIDRAGPDTLAGRLREAAGSADTDPASQLAHWLFAFDAAALATLRALALLATHPEEASRARAELAGADEPGLLRACVLESVRLWPTTPLLLRESTEETSWRGAALPAGTVFAVFTPYFHRGEPAAPYQDAFTPDLWLDGRAAHSAREYPALVPFSAGPGHCPGRDVVLVTAATWLGAMLDRRTYQLDSHAPLHAQLPVPATLDPFELRFTARRG